MSQEGVLDARTYWSRGRLIAEAVMRSDLGQSGWELKRRCRLDLGVDYVPSLLIVSLKKGRSRAA